MRLKIVAAGRSKSGPEAELTLSYRTRLKSAPAQLGPLDILEIDERKDPPRIEKAFMDAAGVAAPGAKLVALDERGENLTTKRFAELLAGWRDGGAPEVLFFVGGADGLPESLRRAAHHVIALGMMTWPHRLARVMLAEQLYRTASLLSGHPYHRE